MSDLGQEYQKHLNDHDAIDAYLKNAAKRNDASYLRHCQATADKARARLLAKEKEV
jgi:DNA-binding phage protein